MHVGIDLVDQHQRPALVGIRGHSKDLVLALKKNSYPPEHRGGPLTDGLERDDTAVRLQRDLIGLRVDAVEAKVDVRSDSVEDLEKAGEEPPRFFVAFFGSVIEVDQPLLQVIEATIRVGRQQG